MISGEGYSGHAATQFAVTHPERTLRLVLNNSYPRLTRAEGYEIGQLSMDQVANIASMIEHEWGTGRLTAQAAPSLASDPSFLDYHAARERRSASPGTMAAWARAMATSDIRELLPRVTVPTLVYYTGDLASLFPVEHSRYLAEHIPGAILVEAPGRSFYLPAETERLTAWAEFIVGGPAASHTNTNSSRCYSPTSWARRSRPRRWAISVGRVSWKISAHTLPNASPCIRDESSNRPETAI